MRLSNKQRKELEVIRYFIPDWVKFEDITDKDVEQFFAWSDTGVPLGESMISPPWTGLKALYWGKKYRDLQVTSFLEDWGTIINAWSFADDPDYIRQYFAKRLNKPSILGVQ